MADETTVSEPIITAKIKSDVDSLIRLAGIALDFFAKMISLPVIWVAGIIEHMKQGDGPIISELSKCPACGHKGCRLNFIETLGAERGAVERTCYTCGAKAYSATIAPVDKWMPKKQLVDNRLVMRMRNSG